MSLAQKKAEKIINERLWYEKYRPKILDDLKLDKNVKEKFREFISKGVCPNLLFVGLPGSGKTTLSLILIRHIIKHPSDYLALNGSVLGINDVRPGSKIDNFVNTPPVKSKIKIVFIDEADRASKDFFLAFRHFIESKGAVSYILTGNYITAFEQAIISRFQTFHFNALPFDEIMEYCENVLKAEHVKYNKKDLEKIVKYYYPEVRTIIQYLQKNSINGELVLGEETTLSITNKAVQKVVELIMENKVSPKKIDLLYGFLASNWTRIDAKTFVKNLMNAVDPITKLKVAKHAYNITNSTMIDIAIMAMLADIIKY